MPIQFNKQPFTLQEKLDKAIHVTYSIPDIGNASFMRSFIIELVEKSLRKIGEHGPEELIVKDQIEELKRQMQ